MCDFSYLPEGLEHVSIQHLAAEGPVKSFDVGVLIGIAERDVVVFHP